MRPPIDKVLAAMVEDLDGKLAHMPHGGERMMLFGLRSTLGLIARDADEVASLRIGEIDELAALFRDAVDACPPELRVRLQAALEAAAVARDDLRISALERRLDVLRAALIDLQAWAETSAHPQAAPMLERSWDFLVRANGRRATDAKPW